MTRWEYQLAYLQYTDIDDRLKILNKLGSEGWEIVQFTDNDNAAWFKRPYTISEA